MPRTPGPSVRLRLALSYAGVVVVTGALLLAVVWLFLLRYVPEGVVAADGRFVPTRADLVQAFVPRALSVLAVLLVAGLVGGWLLAGRVLAPLDRVAAAARLASAGSLSHRVELPGRSDEFRDLADAFDAMLGRLEAQVAGQQRFAANASHELRTPLAVTRALLDVARDDPDADRDVLVERLRVVNGRAVELTEALLLLSRAEHGASDREPVDLSLSAEEAVETLLPLAHSHGVVLEASGEVVHALGSPALLLQLATNLVHNGIVHNAPPPAGFAVVTARTRRDGDAAVLVVENTGPAVPAELASTLVEPFRRGVGRVRDGHEGTGLGLAVVDAVVRAHGGTLTLTPRVGGGLVVEVRLPRGASGADAGPPGR